MPQTETSPFADLDAFLDRVGQEQVQAQRRAPFAEYRRLQPKPAPPPPAATSDPYGLYAVPAAAGVFAFPQVQNPPPTPPGGQPSRFAFPGALRLPTAPPPPPVEPMGVPPELPATGASHVAAGASPAPTDGDQVATIARVISKA